MLVIFKLFYNNKLFKHVYKIYFKNGYFHKLKMAVFGSHVGNIKQI